MKSPLSLTVRWLTTVRRRAASRPAALVFVVAFVIRLVVATVVAVSSDGALFPDDRGYLQLADRFANSNTAIWEFMSQEFMDDWGLMKVNAGFLLPVGYLFRLFGFHPLLGQVLSALAGAITAAAVTVLVRRHASTSAALFSGLAISTFPSQVLWSSLVLKDSFTWMALALLAMTLGWWTRQHGPGRFVQGFLMLLCITVFLTHLRVHSLVVATIACMIAVLLSPQSQRMLRIGGLLILLAFLPLSVNAGFFGSDLFVHIPGGTGNIRSNMALNARTAFTTATTTATTTPTGRGPYLDLIYLPQGLRVMFLDPLPNHLNKSPNMKYAFAEHLLWYPLLLLALIGVVTRRKSLTPEIVFTVLVTGGLATMWALVEGNFGTAYRHRGELVWGVAVLAGIGLDHLLNNCRPYPMSRKQESPNHRPKRSQQSSGMVTPPAP